MVSLRGRELRLLPLRGRFTVDGEAAREVTLAAGQTLHLAPDLALQVLAVELPDEILALEGDGLPRRALTGSCSLFTRPAPRFAPGFDPAAPIQLWSIGDDWRIRREGETHPLLPGDTFVTDGRRFTAVSLTVDQAGAGATRARGAFQRPLRLVARYDSVHIHREGEPAVVLAGVAARLLSELVAFDGPVEWETLAREVWTDGAEPAQLRRKWDVSLARLRRKLRDAKVRDDLIRSDGTGLVELVRYPGDTIEDRM